MSARRAVARAIAACTAAALALTGCGALKLEQLPSPAGVSGPTYHLTAQFGDVSGLVLGAKIKLQGVVIGDVTSISTRDFHAEVGMEVSKKFPLDAASTFQIRFTTPLGEDFIAASAPSKATGHPFADGATVSMQQTGAAPGIEDTFAALSLLLNGGGLDKLHIIADELDKALSGRGSAVQDTLVQLHSVISDFDANKGEFDTALDNLNSMAKTLAASDNVVAAALGSFPQTFALLAQDTGEVRTLLGKVATLGTTVKGLLDRSQADMVADFDALRPTLDSLRSSETNLVPTFNALIDFGKDFDQATPGDYVNSSITIRFLLNAPGTKPVPGGQLYPGAEPTGQSAANAGTATDSVHTLAALMGGAQ
jgi:phospholipid/cholesterol/gamma-HCH transport system substrate-binding protein